ncbi:CHASE3 domain-containing protein [Luteolibacter flavescens]|uniref:histidine kinase n=1 Tax=Luteolibacter flavescens TaxID=1859460 RepID=A0ABT3FU52_9BACT|nr:CHASE3 domain-containing protein [Luteolibacter flavescens]MCW1887116.1 CHASE3 domain-containing protein [Luteolibacter flavescens]
MRRHLKARYLVPAIVALVMIIYGAVTSVRNTRAILVDAKGVDHTHRVMIELESCLIAMLNLETGHRGYVITGQEEYLAPYHDALDAVDQQMEALKALTDDNPEQQARMQRVLDLVKRKKAELQDGIVARHDQGFAAAAAIVETNLGRSLMDEIRQIIDAMRDEEKKLLAERKQRMVKNFKDTNDVVVTTAAIALLAGVTGVVLLGLYLMAKDREVTLEQGKRKAEEADQAKTDFLAMMSHEIRTPLNAILGFGELLHESVVKPQDKHFANAIVTSGRSLLALINDLLDLSKIEAGKLELNPESVEMRRFAENLETLFAYRTREKGLDFSILLDRSVPACLGFDALRLRQVLVNLIGNAVKFTHNGRVTVTMHGEGDGEEMMLAVEVEDTGIGIDAVKLRDIFRPFYQVESQEARHYQGTGLGLSICERLVSLMDGEMGARSTMGEGSVFHLRVPVRRCEGAAEGTGASINDGMVDFNRLAPAKILVVDDVPMNRDLIRGYLHGTHHEVLEAENGEQAVMSCLRLRPHVVLMDLRMPVTDGRSAHAMLKASAETRDIPLVAMSASELLEGQPDLKRIFDGHASKPVSRERLYLELARFLPVHAAAATARPRAAVPVVIPASDRTWPELRPALERLCETRLPALVKLVPAQATAGFAGELAGLAESHDCPPLEDYARRLATAAGTMDVAEAGRLLEAFPGVIELIVADA